MSANTSIRGTLSYSINDISEKKLHKRYKARPFIVVERFRGRLLNTFPFEKRAEAEGFIVRQIRGFR